MKTPPESISVPGIHVATGGAGGSGIEDVRVAPCTTWILAALLGVAALLASCARPPAPPDTLRLAVASAPEALDPRFTTSAVATRLSALVAAPLVVIGDDLRPVPFLAASLDAVLAGAPGVPAGGAAFRVKLKDGVRFHDGNPVTARDVAWTFRSMREVGSPHVGKLSHLVDVVVEDDRTALFVLDAPYAPFLVDLQAYGILEEAVCARAVEACRQAPMGAGPYRVARPLDDGEVLVLEAWDGSPLPPPSIRRIEVRVVRDNTTRLLELLDGRTDLVASDLLPTDLEVLSRGGLDVESAPGLGFSYLAFNVRGAQPGACASDCDEVERTRRALADPRVRRALAMALDVDRVIATKLRGKARRATGLLPEGHWAYAPTPAVPFDPAAAEALLDEAGYPRREDGRFHLTLATTTDRLRKAVALVFADAWRSIGVNVDVEVRDWSALYEDIQRGAFDAFSAKWVPVLEPDLMHWVYSSSRIPAPGRAGGNRGGYHDDELDRWLDEGQRTVDVDARRELYEKAQERVARDLPVVPLWFEDELAAHAPRVKGFALARTVALLPLAGARLEEAR